MKLIVFIWAFLYHVFGDTDSRTLRLKQGLIKGYRDESGVFVYYNIPYATAPIGRDKFKAPLPPPNWTGTREAIDMKVICPQGKMPHDLPSDNFPMENCLIANIYVPDTEKTNLSVVVFVHGGAYQLGSGESIKPKLRVKRDKVIAVNFNYRLGAHGFLCLGTEKAPGNAGMKDQVALLRWVRDNIACFGGNPNDVTINGFSAGSTSVDLLMISKMTAGLFHKVIPESGANLVSWSVQINPVENAKRYAESLNYTEIKYIHDLEEFYLTTDLNVLLSNTFFYEKNSNFNFAPCVENVIDIEVFLDKAPIDILKSGDYPKLPILFGFSNMEGLFRAPVFDLWKDDMNNNFVDYLPEDLHFDNEQQKRDVADSIKKFYFGDIRVCDDTFEGYVNFFSDVMFNYGTLAEVQLHVEAGHKEIYLYEYSYVPEGELPNPMGSPILQRTKIRGADHCSQTCITHEFIFTLPENNLTEEYKEMRCIMQELWSSFTLTGKPSSLKCPVWKPVGADLSPYMSLTMPPQLSGSLLKDRMKFWDQIYQKHYRAPSSPLSLSASTLSKTEL